MCVKQNLYMNFALQACNAWTKLDYMMQASNLWQQGLGGAPKCGLERADKSWESK